MASITFTQAQLVSVSALQGNSTAAHTTTLGPFTVSNAPMRGLWLTFLECRFGVPTAAINEDITLTDITGATVFNWHVNMGIAPMPPHVIVLPLPSQGLVSQNLSGQQQSWSFNTPATTSGPGYSISMIGYIL